MKSSRIARMTPLFLLLLACGGTFAAEARRPNVIFIIADDMYRDMFNCTPEGKGRNVTPTLDRLAASCEGPARSQRLTAKINPSSDQP